MVLMLAKGRNSMTMSMPRGAARSQSVAKAARIAGMSGSPASNTPPPTLILPTPISAQARAAGDRGLHVVEHETHATPADPT